MLSLFSLFLCGWSLICLTCLDCCGCHSFHLGAAISLVKAQSLHNGSGLGGCPMSWMFSDDVKIGPAFNLPKSVWRISIIQAHCMQHVWDTHARQQLFMYVSLVLLSAGSREQTRISVYPYHRHYNYWIHPTHKSFGAPVALLKAMDYLYLLEYN